MTPTTNLTNNTHVNVTTSSPLPQKIPASTTTNLKHHKKQTQITQYILTPKKQQTKSFPQQTYLTPQQTIQTDTVPPKQIQITNKTTNSKITPQKSQTHSTKDNSPQTQHQKSNQLSTPYFHRQYKYIQNNTPQFGDDIHKKFKNTIK